MITPDKVAAAAEKKERQNVRFRTFLKTHADPDKLDAQFLRLHNEIFPRYDCASCRNCCKLISGSFQAEDIERMAEHMDMTKDELIEKYLEPDEYSISYASKHTPCAFLLENGDCALGDCKPEGCKKYPYTDQPERFWSLLSVLETVSVCPAAYEIFEALKREYDFR